MDDVSLVSKLFAAYDRNADGSISRDELVAFFSKHAAPGALLRQLKVESIEAAVEALLKQVDADGDGRIRYRAARARRTISATPLPPRFATRPRLTRSHPRPPTGREATCSKRGARETAPGD